MSKDNKLAYWAYGFALVTEVIGAGLAGYFLGDLADKKWHISPWGVVCGIVIFITVSLVHVVKALERLQK